jgi:hypothetical protein
MNFWSFLFFVIALVDVQIWLFRIYSLLDKRLPQGKSKEEAKRDD